MILNLVKVLVCLLVEIKNLQIILSNYIIYIIRGTLFENNRVIGKIEGSWLESIIWDGVKYWDLEKIDPI